MVTSGSNKTDTALISANSEALEWDLHKPAATSFMYSICIRQRFRCPSLCIIPAVVNTVASQQEGLAASALMCRVYMFSKLVVGVVCLSVFAP